MDNWDFMEFSEISALLKDETNGVVTGQLFCEPDSLTELIASQNGSCSGLTNESPISSPTSDQESIGVSEQSPQISDGNVVEVRNENYSPLMDISTASLLSSSGHNIEETFFSYSQDPMEWNLTSNATASEPQGYMDGNFVKMTDVNWPNSDSFSRLSGKETLALGQTLDVDQLIQSSTVFPELSEGILVKGHDGLSDTSSLLLQRHVPTSYPVSSAGNNFVQSTDEIQSLMQHSIPFGPLSKAKDQLSFGEHSCDTTNRGFKRQSKDKQVILQNQTSCSDHAACLGKESPVNKCGRINAHVTKLPHMRDDLLAPNTVAESQSSVKCRFRSKPGFSTNPRSLTEKTRRKRITERLKELQEIVPMSAKGDNIVEMLDQAIAYVGDLESQLQVLLMRGNQRENLSVPFSQGTNEENETTNSVTK